MMITYPDVSYGPASTTRFAQRVADRLLNSPRLMLVTLNNFPGRGLMQQPASKRRRWVIVLIRPP
jgi:hypothetical protein